jgi:hypothetical protein
MSDDGIVGHSVPEAKDEPRRRGRPKGPAQRAADTSNKSKRTFNRARRRSLLLASLGTSYKELAETSLRSYAQAEALFDLPTDVAERLIAAARRGEKVSALQALRDHKASAPLSQNYISQTQADLETLIATFNRATPDARAFFIKSLGFTNSPP